MHRYQLLSAAALLAAPCVSSAAVLYQDDFNVENSASYNVNLGGATSANAQILRGTAEFASDYSVYGIPAAPGSSDTLGLKLKANTHAVANGRPTTGTVSGVSVSPKNLTLGTQYQVTFYAWSNYFGANTATGVADNVASAGGTNNLSFAVGTSGTNPEIVGATSAANPPVTTSPTGVTLDGVVFATSNDGGVVADYRAFAGSNTPLAPTTSTAYAAGITADAQSNLHAYYSTIPSLAAHAVPASTKSTQLALAVANGEPAGSTLLDGNTQAGSFGFAWHEVTITRDLDTVTWKIDGALIATVDASAVTMGSSFAIGASDVNTSVPRHPDLVFSVIDNLVVSDVPEPASLGLLVPAVVGLLARRRRA